MLTPLRDFVVENDERTYTFRYEAYRGRHLRAVNIALSKRPELTDSGSPATLEMMNYAKSLEICLATIKEWDVCDDEGHPLPINEDNLMEIDPFVILVAARKIERRGAMTKLEAQQQGNASAPSTTAT